MSKIMKLESESAQIAPEYLQNLLTVEEAAERLKLAPKWVTGEDRS